MADAHDACAGRGARGARWSRYDSWRGRDAAGFAGASTSNYRRPGLAQARASTWETHLAWELGTTPRSIQTPRFSVVPLVSRLGGASSCMPHPALERQPSAHHQHLHCLPDAAACSDLRLPKPQPTAGPRGAPSAPQRARRGQFGFWAAFCPPRSRYGVCNVGHALERPGRDALLERPSPSSSSRSSSSSRRGDDAV